MEPHGSRISRHNAGKAFKGLGDGKLPSKDPIHLGAQHLSTVPRAHKEKTDKVCGRQNLQEAKVGGGVLGG